MQPLAFQFLTDSFPFGISFAKGGSNSRRAGQSAGDGPRHPSPTSRAPRLPTPSLRRLMSRRSGTLWLMGDTRGEPAAGHLFYRRLVLWALIRSSTFASARKRRRPLGPEALSPQAPPAKAPSRGRGAGGALPAGRRLLPHHRFGNNIANPTWGELGTEPLRVFPVPLRRRHHRALDRIAFAVRIVSLPASGDCAC